MGDKAGTPTLRQCKLVVQSTGHMALVSTPKLRPHGLAISGAVIITMLAWLFAVPFLVLADMVLAAEGPSAPGIPSNQATMGRENEADDQQVKGGYSAPIGTSHEPENAAIGSDAIYQAQLAKWNALSDRERARIMELWKLREEFKEIGLAFQKLQDDLSNPPMK